jgi:tetratricopeptide (TPR) repeat protein
MEIGAWAEFWPLATFAMEACEDKTSLEYAALCTCAGQLECERGRAAFAKPFQKTAMDIRTQRLPWDHPDMADVYNNFANIINVEWESDEALDEAMVMFQKAIQIDETKPLDERSKVLHVRHMNLGTLYTCQEKWAQAEAELAQGHHYALQLFGPDTHWDAT